MTAEHGPVTALYLASEDVLTMWSERATATADIMTLGETDTQRAIDVITQRRPQVVILEQRFASSARGQAFVHRLRHDPELPPVELRMLLSEHVASLASGHSPLLNAPTAVIALAQPITWPVRRAVRLRVPEGVQVQIDGVPAELVDVSTMGAQVVSNRTLKPNQRVRVLLSHGTSVYRAVAGVAWSSYELPKGQSPQYRAGMEFSDTDPGAIEAFYSRLASSAPPRKKR
jgi:hypothetical protein